MGMDIQLSNSVYNVLKQHTYVEERRAHRVNEKKDQSTAVSKSQLSSCNHGNFALLTSYVMYAFGWKKLQDENTQNIRKTGFQVRYH